MEAPANKIVRTEEALLAMEEDLLSAEVIAVDTETTGFDFWKDSIVGFAFASPKCNYYVPTVGKDCVANMVIIKVVKRILEHHNDKVFHNGKFDIEFIKMLDIDVKGAIHDTMVQAHILDENRKSKKLKDLGEEYIRKDAKEGEEVLKKYFKDNKLEHYGQIPVEIIGPYACRDVELTLALHHKFYPDIISLLFEEVYLNEMALQHFLIDMEMKGVVIDVEYLQKFQVECENQILVLRKQIFDTVGKEFNIDSNDELAVILYNDLQLPVVDKSAKTGKPSVDKYTLEKLTGKHPLIPLLEEYRGLSKLTSTYIKGILDKVVEENKIHADFQQVGTSTGRLSCWNPNLQNIPRGDVIRKAFLNPLPKEAQLLFYDYSQIEYRMVAHYSKDEIMIEGFHKKMDVHTWVGMKLFNLTADKLTKEHRIKAKQINFGIVYGMGKRALASKLQCTEAEAGQFLANYYAAFPKLQQFIFDVRSAARRRGYIKNFIGRHRRLKVEESYKAVNALCQGSAADILKTAINRVGSYLKDKKSYMIMNVHDELIIVHYLDEPEVIKEVKDLMEDFQFRVPIVVEIECSDTNWGEKKPLKEVSQ